MVTSKPFMIAPKAESPDYAAYVRRTLSERLGQRATFAQTLETQQAASQAAAPAEDRQGSAPGRGQETAANAEKARPAGIPLSGRSPSGRPLYRSGGLSLDRRSLSVLQNVDRSERPRPAPVKKTTSDGEGETPGRLSARYESGNLGAAAIGYDRNGGTSYGKYQISSRQGTFKSFLSFLDKQEPAMAERLRKAGQANTGSARGAVPDAWKALTAEQPERFEQLQEEFIRDSHYRPALEGVQGILGGRELSPTMREVLWSTAVQHGPEGAKRLFGRAVDRIRTAGGDPADEKKLIDTVYNLRKGQFASSTPGVQAAVRNRFDDERRQALAMLKQQTMTA